MTDEEIYTEGEKRYPRRWSGDVENSNNSDKFIEGAEWAREQMINKACACYCEECEVANGGESMVAKCQASPCEKFKIFMVLMKGE